MATKLVRGTGIFLLACIFIVYPIWVSFPKEKYSRELREATKQVKERFDAQQAKAGSVETNGYLAPNLLTTWVIKPDYDESKSIDSVLIAWNEYSSAGTGEEIDHRALLSDSKYLETRREFAKYVPEMKKAFLADVFIVPLEKDYTFYDFVPNFIAIRRAAQNMTGYVESLWAERKYDEALAALGPTFNLGYNLERGPTLIEKMIGIAIQAIAFQCLVEEVEPKAPVSAGAWQTLAQQMVRSLTPEELLVQSLEGEVWVMENSIERWRSGGSDDFLGDFDGVVARLPGGMNREHRIYRNVMGQLIEELKKGSEYGATLNLLFEPAPLDYFLGRNGKLAILGVPNFIRAGAQARVMRAKMLGGAAATGALAYRAKYGKLPESLEQLKDIQVEIPASENLRYTRTGNKAEILVQVATSDLENTSVRENAPKSKWFEWLEYGALFKI